MALDKFGIEIQQGDILASVDTYKDYPPLLCVADGGFTNLRTEAVQLTRTGDVSTNFRLENTNFIGNIVSTISDDIVLINSLVIGAGSVAVDAIQGALNAASNSSIINTSPTGAGMRSRNAGTNWAVNDTVSYTAGTGESFNILSSGTYSGDYNAGHEVVAGFGANSITTLTKTLADIFTNPAGNDYSPKVGGPLDGTSSTGGFIGAVDLGGGGGFQSAWARNSNYMIQ